MGLTVREYAAREGITLRGAQKRIAKGLVKKLPDGTVDPESAAEYRALHLPSAEANQKNPESYSRVRAAHELLKAKKTKLELEEMEGRKIDVEVVEKIFFNTFRALRDRILDMPVRLAAPIVAVAREGESEPAMAAVRVMLDGELRSILDEVSDGPDLGIDKSKE